MTASHYEPESRELRLDLQGFAIACKLWLYHKSDSKPVVVIVQPSTETYATYHAQTERVAVYVCNLFGIETHSLLWIERLPEGIAANAHQFFRVDFPSSALLELRTGSEQASRTPLALSELRLIVRSLGYVATIPAE